jgi:5'-phosphate synthase pdxT subunit
MRVGVLALQGDFREHLIALNAIGVDSLPVNRVSELEQIDGLILPGGESTTIAKLAKIFGLFDPIRAKIREGLPTYGSCAGLILLADRILDGAEGQETFGGLDITARRNAFGRQVDSFETDIEFKKIGKLNGVFIRAPWVEEVGVGVEILASAHDHPVAVRHGAILATSFHPELTQDHAVHRYFLEEICQLKQ